MEISLVIQIGAMIISLAGVAVAVNSTLKKSEERTASLILTLSCQMGRVETHIAELNRRLIDLEVEAKRHQGDRVRCMERFARLEKE